MLTSISPAYKRSTTCHANMTPFRVRRELPNTVQDSSHIQGYLYKVKWVINPTSSSPPCTSRTFFLHFFSHLWYACLRIGPDPAFCRYLFHPGLSFLWSPFGSELPSYISSVYLSVCDQDCELLHGKWWLNIWYSLPETCPVYHKYWIFSEYL